MNRRKWISVVLFLSGLLILLLPDQSGRVVKFNNLHGPSLLDLVGLFLIFTGWLISCIYVFNRRAIIIKTHGLITTYFLFSIYLLSLSGIVFALADSLELLLWTCAGLAILINAFFILATFNKKIG